MYYFTLIRLLVTVEDHTMYMLTVYFLILYGLVDINNNNDTRHLNIQWLCKFPRLKVFKRFVKNKMR